MVPFLIPHTLEELMNGDTQRRQSIAWCHPSLHVSHSSPLAILRYWTDYMYYVRASKHNFALFHVFILLSSRQKKLHDFFTWITKCILTLHMPRTLCSARQLLCSKLNSVVLYPTQVEVDVSVHSWRSIGATESPWRHADLLVQTCLRIHTRQWTARIPLYSSKKWILECSIANVVSLI